MYRGPRISNRTALIAMLALTVIAFLGVPGNAEDSEAVAERAESAPRGQASEPAAGVADKAKFRLLLLRRG
jgi:hypothetical protein